MRAYILRLLFLVPFLLVVPAAVQGDDVLPYTGVEPEDNPDIIIYDMPPEMIEQKLGPVRIIPRREPRCHV